MAGSPEFLASFVARLKSAVVQRVIGVAVLVIVGATFAGMHFLGGHAAATEAPSVSPASAVHHVVHAPARTANAVASTAHAANGKPVVRTVKPGAAVAVVRKGSPAASAQSASAPGTDAPVVTAVPQNDVPTASPQAHIDDHLTYQYNALGRRDPFQSLVDGAFVGADVGGDAPPDPGGIKVVGIVWGATDQFALVEDVRGNSFVLRKGDKVQNGVVEGLKRDGVIVSITAEGQSQSVVIPLVRKGDQNAH